MKLHPLLLAPIVLCFSAMADESPQQAPLLVEQLLADFKASPQAVQDFYWVQRKSFRQWSQDYQSQDEAAPPLKPFESYVALNCSMIEQSLNSLEQYDAQLLPELYQAYHQESIKIWQDALAAWTSAKTHLDYLKASRQSMDELEALRDSDAYDGMRPYLKATEGLGHMATILACIQLIKQYQAGESSRDANAHILARNIARCDMLEGLCNTSEPFKADVYPFNISSVEELSKQSKQLASIANLESMLALEMSSCDQLLACLKQCNKEQKSLLFAYLALKTRSTASKIAKQNQGESTIDESFASSLLALYPSDAPHAEYWAQWVAIMAKEQGGSPSEQACEELQQIRAQNPAAAAYFAMLQLDSSSKLIKLLFNQDDIMERCQDKAGNLKKQLKEKPEQAAELIHYGSQIIYAQTLAEMFDEFAALYRVLAK